jgi:hypothetical protein
MQVISLFENQVMPTGTITVKHIDKDGSVIMQFDQPIDSFVIDHWRTYVYGIHIGTGSRIAWDAGGGANAYNSIIVGSGTNNVAYANTTLQTQILHGNTTGTLAAAAPTATYNAATGALTLSRTFTNNFDGASVSVAECGIRVNTGNSTSSTGGLLIVRDKLAFAISVDYLQGVVVEYDIQLPYGTTNYNYLFTRHLIGRTNDEMILVKQDGTTTNGTFGTGNDMLNFITESTRDDRGIVVGSSSSAFSFADYAMGSKISNGSNTGELRYGDSMFTVVASNTTASNFTEWRLVRWFKNESGSNVTINEIGLSSNATIASTNSVFLFDRRVLSAPVTVGNNELVTVNWKFRYDF